MSKSAMAAQVDAWFAARGWKVFPFQRAVWKAAVAGQSGLLHANTGAGKTYAVWFAALLRGALASRKKSTGLRVLWITPMRALAADTLRALEESAAALAPGWTVGARTGDTSSAERARQSRKLPSTLVTTPESLSLLLSHAQAREQFASLDMIIIDEWHELMGTKRGVQVQLALARLRHWNPELVVWALSATMGNLDQARTVLLGEGQGVLVEGDMKKQIVVDSLVPPNVSRFPWGGHLGIQMLQPVIDEIEQFNATLVFTNTRSQSEIWYQNLIDARPDWAGLIALHHGSLDRKVRDWVETGLKKGDLKAVICTDSLDLGVDFLPVERVLQIGSAKGIAGLLQRPRAGAGLARDPRAHQQPGDPGGGGRQGGCGFAQHRGPAGAQQTLRRAGAAPGDGGAGRRLRAGGHAGRSAHGLVLPPPDGRGMAVGAGLHQPGRPESHRLSRVPARAGRRGGCVAGAEYGDRAAPPHEHRHHRVRFEHAGEVHERGPHRQRGRILHLAPESGRLFSVRRAHARIHSRQRDDGLRQAGRGQEERRRHPLGGRQDAAVLGAGPCRAGAAAPGLGRAVHRPRDAGDPAPDRDPAGLVGLAHHRHPGD